MTLTDALKQWLRDNKGVAKDADDETYRKAAAAALIDDSLTEDKMKELTKDPDADKATTLSGKMDAILESVAKNQTVLADVVAKLAERVETQSTQMKKVESGITDADIAKGSDGANGDDGLKIRHKTAASQYSTTTSQLYFPPTNRSGQKHPRAGDRLSWGDLTYKRCIDEPSELDRAVVGAYFKWRFLGPLVARNELPKNTITDHDRELLQYAVENMKWAGSIDEHNLIKEPRLLTDLEQKQVPVRDDGGASGGLEAVPIVFDDMVIRTPLLHSEFFPRVNVVNIPRGRRIEGVQILNVVMTWNATEATAIALHNVSNFVTAFDTNIMTVTGSIQIGRDFLSDTPLNFGDIVTQEYGQALMAELDEVIADGNGTTEPTGVNAGTANAVPLGGGAWTASGVLTMISYVDKQYINGADRNRVCFGGNQTTYYRIRAVATGVTGDTRFIFGNDVEDYMVMGHPFLIHADFTNAEAVFVNLARYRLYRRLGFTSESTTQGQTLMLNNQLLMVIRARFGGQLEDTEAGSHTITAQA